MGEKKMRGWVSPSDCCRPCERRDPYAAAVIAGKDKITNTSRNQLPPVVMGPCVRRDDGRAFGFNFKEETHLRVLAAPIARALHLRLALLLFRGRREDRVHAAPAVSRAIAHRRRAHEHTGSAETLRPSLRSGFTAYSELSPVNGSFATVAPKKLASQELDASTAASGPHDFAVRVGRLRLARLSRPPHLTARS